MKCVTAAVFFILCWHFTWVLMENDQYQSSIINDNAVMFPRSLFLSKSQNSKEL
jgi:hypothetical protein